MRRGLRSWARKQQHFRSQVYYLRGLDGRIGLDFIGRFETLTHDYQLLIAALGVRVALQRVNVTARRDSYVAYYDKETKAIVAEVYRDDLRTFGYTFDD